MLQQAVQVIRLIGGLVVLTLLARTLSLAELGTYALLLSIGGYVIFVRQSIVSAAIMGVAEARSRQRLDTVVSTGLAIYGLAGIASALLLTGIGLAVLPILNLPDALAGDARLGVLGIAAMTVLGWPVQVFDDALRGLQRFTAVSLLELFALVVWVGGAILLIHYDASLWMLVTLNASIPLLQGFACFVALPIIGVRLRIRPLSASRKEMTCFGGLSATLLLGGLPSLVTYSLDRAILSGFRGASSVGLYEGPLQAQNTLRFLNGVLSAPLVPILSGLRAKGDVQGIGEVVIRALRLSMAVTTPIVILFICLPASLLTAWLGPQFSEMGAETAAFCSYWLIGSVTGVVGIAILTSGGAWILAVNSWIVAVVNLVVTVGVTWQAGIWGPIVGSISGFLVGLCLLVPVALHVTGLSAVAVLRRAILPALRPGLAVAVALIALRLLADPTSPFELLATATITCFAYWGGFAIFCSTKDERTLVRGMLNRVSA